MTVQLTAAEFKEATKGIRSRKEIMSAVRDVLVNGMKQINAVEKHNVSKQTLSKRVMEVTEKHRKSVIPDGCRLITVCLPDDMATKVEAMDRRISGK